MQPLYINSFANAKTIGEIDLWRESHRENIKCKNAIDRLVSDRYNGSQLPRSIIEDACEEYGIDRVGWVLANTVNESEYDGRYRPSTKLWAKTVYGIPNERWNNQNMKNLINSIKNKCNKAMISAKTAIESTTGEGYIDTGVKIIIGVVIGGVILAGLYALFNTTIMPTLTTKIQGFFNYKG